MADLLEAGGAMPDIIINTYHGGATGHVNVTFDFGVSQETYGGNFDGAGASTTTHSTPNPT